jgi:hypothetical protein
MAYVYVDMEFDDLDDEQLTATLYELVDELESRGFIIRISIHNTNEV